MDGVTLDRTYTDGYYALGFAIGYVRSYTLPNDAPKLNTGAWHGGDSAGLMMAIQAVSILSQKDLTHGIDIAGTGTIDTKGNVGPIGGLYNKIASVKRDGKIHEMFVPKDQQQEALSDQKVLHADSIHIHAVTNLQEVVNTLDAVR